MNETIYSKACDFEIEEDSSHILNEFDNLLNQQTQMLEDV